VLTHLSRSIRPVGLQSRDEARAHELHGELTPDAHCGSSEAAARAADCCARAGLGFVSERCVLNGQRVVARDLISKPVEA
jgi:hypothetical protein